MADAILGGVISELTTIAASYLSREVNFVFNYNDMVRHLKKAISKLIDQKKDLQEEIDAAGEGNVITHVTESWLLEVIKLEERVKELMNVCEKKIAKINLKARRDLTKEAGELINEVVELMKERVITTKIFLPMAVIPYGERLPMEFQDYSSMRGILDEVIDDLENKKNFIVAIYGMGGIGKTTLIDQIGRRMEQQVFDVVIFVGIPQNQDESEIQNSIAEQLGMTFNANRVDQRCHELVRKLKRVKKILIMLDNLWKEVDLRKIGIPFGDDHKGCKILLTTRKIEVCKQMTTNAHYPVSLLSEEDSWHLFEKKAGEVVKQTEIKSIAKEVMRECANLPLALVVVGLALREECDRNIWDNALRQLRESNPRHLDGVEENLFKCLELSYIHLDKDDVKLLFLLCSMFPDGHELSKDELTQIWIGENIFEGFSNVNNARGNMDGLLSKLINSCLLQRTKKVKIMKMHDVVRDVAIYIASRDENGFVIKYGLGTEDLLEEEFSNESKTKRISLINSGVAELPDNPNAPELKVLLLRKNMKLKILPDNFFEGMKKLTVLDLSDSNFESLPYSLQSLENLRVFSLNRCKKLHGISTIGKLKNLLVLSWQACKMGDLPNEIGGLTKLKFLDLSLSPELKLPSQVLNKLRHLEEMYLDSKYLNTIVLIEIAGLKKLKCLQLCIKEDYFSGDMITANSLESLEAYVLYNRPSSIKMARYRKNLYIKGLKQLKWVNSLLSKVEDLRFDHCFGDADTLFLSDKEDAVTLLELAGLETETGFNELKILHISNCQHITHLIKRMGNSAPGDKLEETENAAPGDKLEETENSAPGDNLEEMENSAPGDKLEELYLTNLDKLSSVFQIQSCATTEDMFNKLKAMYLHGLPKLSDICNGEIPAGSFGNLRDLHIQGCNELKYIFTARVITGFKCLEKLILYDNANIEEIISDDGFILDENAFPKLMALVLVCVPNLKHFYKVGAGIKTFFWPLLKNVKLGGCRRLRTLPIGCDSAPELKKIELVGSCERLWYGRLVWDNKITSSRFETL
ncbi:hypothetical protein LUZ60_010760 [Juncus effusus]|nr:hypothetical protein LUZ60_010760 [Juncus effusus]